MKKNWRRTRLTAGALTAALLLTSGALASEQAAKDRETAPQEETAVAETAEPAGVIATAEETAEPAASGDKSLPEEPASAAEGAGAGEAGAQESAGEPAKPYIQPAAQTAEDWRLLLVNPWNALPEGYAMELATLANGLKVDQRIYADLTEMLTACRAAGLDPIVCSAYRTQATQVRLYNNKIARLRAAGWTGDALLAEAARWVAPPGTSEHQSGLALDIVAASYQLLDDAQADTAEQQWLMAHSWEYGFILRYPEDKTEITGIGYEPWHYRYVGRETAAAIHDSGLCLEEYLAALSVPVEGPVGETVPAEEAAESVLAAESLPDGSTGEPAKQSAAADAGTDAAAE